jgi:DNA-directed RNA polymerase specialized sigma subunit
LTEIDKLFQEKINDKNVIKITNKAASRFRKYLTRDEIQSCINFAIIKALSKYKENAGLKFTTYIYRGVILECKTQKNKNFGRSKFRRSLSDIFTAPASNYIELSSVMEVLEKEPDGQMVIDKYLYNYTTKEIATKYNASIETIRTKIIQTIENVQLALN